MEEGNKTGIIYLGSRIELIGFHDIDYDAVPVVRKIVGHGVKIISEKSSGLEKIKISLKKVHSDHGTFEVSAKAIINGSAYSSDVSNRNLFFALADALKKIEHQLSV